MKSLSTSLIALLLAASIQAQTNDPFLHRLYDQRHDSPPQQRFRQIAPMPAGVV